MRGCFSLFSKERDLKRYGTGIFVASAEDDVIARVLPTLPRHFPHVAFTFVMAKRYAELFSSAGEVLRLEDIKASPTRWLAFLRKRRFDLCIVLCAGRPTYRKTKLAALLLSARRTIVYNEYGDSFLLDRAHWKALLAHVGRRTYKYRPGTLLFPIGLIYLAARTLWLGARARCGLSVGKVRSRSETARTTDMSSSRITACNICGKTVRFTDPTNGVNLRESLVCPSCRSTSRDRKLVYVLGLALGLRPPARDWPESRSFRIFETSGYRGHVLFFERKFDYYNTRYDPEKIAAGADPRSYADVQDLPYPANFFDCVLSSDVFEHVRLDDEGFREIFRVLKLGGIFVLQVPYSHTAKTRTLVLPDGDKDILLEPPQYHAEHTLVYRVYGCDLLDRLQRYGFSVSRLHLAILEYGISAQDTFLMRKGSYVQLELDLKERTRF